MNRDYFMQVAIAFDQLLNALFAGYADETISSRAFRCQHQKRRWKIARIVIDKIFFWQDAHCMEAFISEAIGGHLPRAFHEMLKGANQQAGHPWTLTRLSNPTELTIQR